MFMGFVMGLVVKGETVRNRLCDLHPNKKINKIQDKWHYYNQVYKSFFNIF
jgi:hypothetical protein